MNCNRHDESYGVWVRRMRVVPLDGVL